ncbi:hypothetical protein [Intrasporangium flavum]|uniref:hypothetical protein n=1 Tax=Intrasporangium flavum TaxID=1428657 RepID=UPI001A978A7F|nr:hypothetical protein [Intrasporangium flavum]
MLTEPRDRGSATSAPEAGDARAWVPRSVLVVISGYVVLRCLNFLELWWASTAQSGSGPANPGGSPSEYFVHSPTPPSPGLGGLLSNWDGQWYERIATDGYPTGDAIRSPNDAWAWAFPPLFPALARLVMAVTGLGFPAASIAVNLLLGLLASLLLLRILCPAVGAVVAAVAAVSLNAFPSAPLLGLAYSEPAALLLVLLTLSALMSRRYGLAFVWIALLSLTRPVAVPFAVVIAVQWWSWHRDPAGRPAMRVRVASAACALLALASPWLWSTITGIVAGRSAGTRLGNGPLSGTARASSMLRSFEFGWFGGLWRAGGPAVVLLLALAVVILLLGAVLLARRLDVPPELCAWGVAYVVFVLLVTPVTPGVIRYLLLAAPFLATALAALLRNRPSAAKVAGLIVVTLLALWGQWLWIRYLYILDPAPALLPWAP